jgi:oxygen-independent coproporphyrinogen-3 oxidase
MKEPANIDGLYVHVPFCDGKCGYCAFYSVPYTEALVDRWLGAVQVETRLLAAEFGRIKPKTVFFGGGTPSLMTESQLQRLVGILREQILVAQWDPRDGVEWTAEANPGSLTKSKLELFRSVGINRISLGVQSFFDDVLMSLERRHTVADVEGAIRAIQEAGLDNWGMDLIACVPGVDLERWGETLRRVERAAPKHVSVYALTSEEGAKLSERIRRGDLALLDDERQLSMLRLAEDLLGDAGYRKYEISNFAMPGYECRHNLSCWRGGDYVGVGCGASSHVGWRRWTNQADLAEYVRMAGRGERPLRDEEILTPLLHAAERMVFGIRLGEGVNPAQIVAATGCDVSVISRWQEKLVRLAGEGYVTGTGDVWTLTRRGREMADYVAVELMP